MRKIFFLFFTFGILFRTAAQEVDFRKVELPEPVRNSTLNLLYTDRSGFLWIAAHHRLYRYSGLRFRETLTDTAGRPGDVITALFEDSQAQLWIGWKSGFISRQQQDSTVAYSPEEGTPSAAIVKWAEDGQNQLWMATDGEGLYVLAANDRWYHFGREDGLPAMDSYDLVPFGDGVLLATDRGLVKASFAGGNKKVEVTGVADGLSDQIVKSIFKYDEGVLLGYYEQHIDLLTSSGEIQSQQAPPAADCHQLLRSGGNTWWLSENGRLYKNRGEKGWVQLNPGGEGRVRVEHLSIDSESHLWVATNRGLFMANQWRGKLLPGTKVTALAMAGDTLYYAHEGDLHCQNLSSAEAAKLWEGDYVILSLFTDYRGRIWAGTFDAGLVMYDQATGQKQVFNEDFGIPNNNVLSVTGDSSGIWIGTFGGAGFLPFENEGFGRPQRFTGEEGEPVQYIYAVQLGPGGEVFLATDGDGVLQKRGSSFEPVGAAEKEQRVVLDLSMDASGRLWWIDQSGKLFHWKTGGEVKLMEPPQTERGSPAGLEAGADGSIYIFYEEGILRYFPQGQRWTFYGTSFGLGGLQPELHAQAITGQRLYIGTASGVVSVDMSLLPAHAQPATFLRGAELFFKPVHRHHFDAGENHLTFNYIGRWYTDPERVRYRIKLEGYDLEWSISQNTSVTYPRLSPGDYTFKVVAGIDEHFPPGELKTYSFSIASPWYVRWYSIVAAVLLILGIIWLYMRLRLKRIRQRQEQEKEQVRAQYEALKSQVNPHFLFNSFNTLMALIEEDKEQAGDYLSHLSDFFRNILQYREVDLYSLEEELRIVSTYLKLQEKRYGAKLQVKIDVPDECLSSGIPPLSLQLLLENVFKHNVISRSRPLQVRIFVEDGNLVVWNVYQEKSQKEASTGYGLQSIGKKYSFYTRKEIQVVGADDHFAVYLPILKNPEL